MQPVSVHGAHGHACTHTLCLSHQGAEPHPRGPGGWQADHSRRGQAGGGKELAEELHRSEPGGVTPLGISLVGPPSGSLANPPAAPARPAGVQYHIHLLQTLTPSLSYLQTHPDKSLPFTDGCCLHLFQWLQTKWRLVVEAEPDIITSFFRTQLCKLNQLTGYTSYFRYSCHLCNTWCLPVQPVTNSIELLLWSWLI